MRNLHTFLQECGGKPTGKGVEWLFNCPLCDGIDKFYFNTQKLVGFCVKCSTPLGLERFARLIAGISLGQVQEWMKEQSLNEVHKVGLMDSILLALSAGAPTTSTQKTLPAISYPSDYRSLEDGRSSVTGMKAIRYLQNRGFALPRLYRLQFGYCASGYYAGRVIIPFFEDGQLVYWQARDFTGKVPLREKILNPPSWECPTGKSQVLFNYDVAKSMPTLVVNESWGSALAVGDCAVGLNGKAMSQEQFDKLKSSDAEQFVVLLDHGAEENAWKTGRQLSAIRPTLMAFLPYGDPAEVPKSVLLQALREAVPYSKLAYADFMTHYQGSLNVKPAEFHGK